MNIDWRAPKHPIRITLALSLAGVAGAIGPTSLALQIVAVAGALQLLWEL